MGRSLTLEEKALRLLQCAKKRLIEKGWNQGSLALDATGKEVGVFSRQAVSYCALGALEACTTGTRIGSGNSVARSFLERACDGSVVFYNDSRGRRKADILHLYDRAIQRAEEEAAKVAK